jgi:hypothetical protein
MCRNPLLGGHRHRVPCRHDLHDLTVAVGHKNGFPGGGFRVICLAGCGALSFPEPMANPAEPLEELAGEHPGGRVVEPPAELRERAAEIGLALICEKSAGAILDEAHHPAAFGVARRPVGRKSCSRSAGRDPRAGPRPRTWSSPDQTAARRWPPYRCRTTFSLSPAGTVAAREAPRPDAIAPLPVERAPGQSCTPDLQARNVVRRWPRAGRAR